MTAPLPLRALVSQMQQRFSASRRFRIFPPVTS